MNYTPLITNRGVKALLLFPVFVLALGMSACHDVPEAPKHLDQERPIMKERKKVTGVGGIFFKCEDPEKMKQWYSKNLGLVTDEYGSTFVFRTDEKPDEKAYLQWSPFSEKTKYFEPSKKDFMINYRVENIESLVQELKAAGVEVLDDIESFDYGKFVHIMDPEGNKIELWEPVDQVFTDMAADDTAK